MTTGIQSPTAGRPGFGSVLWALIPLLTLGLLTPFAFVYAAARVRQRRMWVATAAYALACTLWLVGASMPESSAGPAIGTLLLLGVIIVGTTHAFLVRRRVFTPALPQPALQAALQARQRRTEARLLASRDVGLARDLCIGRPDLPHAYDDGGLVDVNHVPPAVLVDRLGLSPDEAASVVTARDGMGGFSSADELIVYTTLTAPAVQRFQDHLVFLG